MIKFFWFSSLLLITNISYAGQVLYGIQIYFENKCAYPVVINVVGFSNRNDASLNETVSMNAAPNEKVLVLSHIQGGYDVQYVVPDNYTLGVAVNDKKIILDKLRFIQALEKGEYHRESCGIFCSTDTFSGTISDPSLCP